MAVLGKLFGKKKDEDDDFLAYDRTMPGAATPGPAGFGAPGGDMGLGAPALPSIAPQMVQKDMELITSKLDALKVSMDTILQRLANIEARLAQQQQPVQQPQPQQQQSFGFGTQQPQQQQQPQDTGWHF